MKFLTGACALSLVAITQASPALVNRDSRPHSSRSGVSKAGTNQTQKMIPVVVGGAQLSFTPNQIVAAPGDIVQFQFANGAHTVTQSAEQSPCVPLQDTMPNSVYSGRIPFQNGQTTVGTFNMKVNSTEPMFLYCSTGPHCQLGQVLVINPTSPEQIVNYAKKAAMATSNTDAKAVFGGTTGQIPLADAAFVPAQPPAAAPSAAPSAAPPAGKKNR